MGKTERKEKQAELKNSDKGFITGCFLCILTIKIDKLSLWTGKVTSLGKVMTKQITSGVQMTSAEAVGNCSRKSYVPI